MSSNKTPRKAAANRAATDSRSDVLEKVKAQEREASSLAKSLAKLEPTSAWKAGRLALIRRNHPGTSSEIQRQRLMMAFALVRSVSTQECRQHLDIHSPASRVRELRTEGANIQTVIVLQETKPGCRHRFAKYLLAPKGGD